MEVPKSRRRFGQIQTTVLVTPELYEKCKLHNIKFSEAMRVGIGVLLAERGLREYDTNLNLFRRMNQFREMFEEMSVKYEKLYNQLEGDNKK